MPNSTISGLPAAGALTIATDVLPIVTGGATKKVTPAALYAAVAGLPTSAAGFAGLAAWYDSQQQVGVDGAGVATLTDFGSGARNLASAGGAQPVYRAAGIGGLPAVEFDGATMWYSGVGNVLGTVNGAGAFTMFAVIEPNLGVPTQFQTVLAAGSVGWAANTLAALYITNGALVGMHNGGAVVSGAVKEISSAAIGNPGQVFIASFDGLNVYVYLNGMFVASGNASLSALVAGGVTTIGNNTFNQMLKGRLGEAGILTRGLLGQELQDFNRMLLRRWGISSY